MSASVRGSAGRHDRDLLARLLEPADRLQHRRGAQALDDVGRAQVQRRRALGVEHDLDLAHVAAQHLDAADAADARQRRAQHQLADLAQAARIDRRRSG